MNHKNQGFSILELLVAVAILAIVSVMVFGFMNSGMISYTKNNNSMNLQQEAQLAMDQIQEVLIDATSGVNYYINNSYEAENDDCILPSGEAVSSKTICVYNREENGGTEYRTCSEISWEESSRELYYTVYEMEEKILPNGTKTLEKKLPAVEDKSLLAEHVTDFAADLTKARTEHKVELKLGFQVKNQTFHTKKTVTLRNQVAVNAGMDETFQEVTIVSNAGVDAVLLTPAVGYAELNTVYNEWTAQVIGKNYPTQTVQWELTNQPSELSPGTVIDAATGRLTIAADEKSEVLHIKATSVLSQELEADGKGSVKWATADVRIRSLDKDEPIRIQSVTYKEDLSVKVRIHIKGKNLSGEEDFSNRITLKVWDENKKDVLQAGAVRLAALEKSESTDKSHTSVYEAILTTSDPACMNVPLMVEAAFDRDKTDIYGETFKLEKKVLQSVKIMAKDGDGEWEDYTNMSITSSRGEAIEYALKTTYTNAEGSDPNEVLITAADTEKWKLAQWTITYEDGTAEGLEQKLTNHLAERGILGIRSESAAFPYEVSFVMNLNLSYGDSGVVGTTKIRLPAVSMKIANNIGGQNVMGLVVGNRNRAVLRLDITGLTMAGQAELRCEVNQEIFTVKRIENTHNYYISAVKEGMSRLQFVLMGTDANGADAAAAKAAVNIAADESNVKEGAAMMPYYVPVRTDQRFFNGTVGAYHDLYGHTFQYDRQSDTRMTLNGSSYRYDAKKMIWNRE